MFESVPDITLYNKVLIPVTAVNIRLNSTHLLQSVLNTLLLSSALRGGLKKPMTVILSYHAEKGQGWIICQMSYLDYDCITVITNFLDGKID